MAGHSKWANIKHRKASQDAKRGRLFTRLLREITVAARGGLDTPRLKLAVTKAMAENVPKDTVERAVARGSGGGDDTQLDEIIYEGYGPAGVAVLVECVTDNRNRTVAEVRSTFARHGGNLGTDGSVAYLFRKVGVVCVPGSAQDEERLIEVALEAGASDIEENEADGGFRVLTESGNLHQVFQAVEGAQFSPESAELVRIAETYVDIEKDTEESVEQLLNALEDLDDTQNVYANVVFTDD